MPRIFAVAFALAIAVGYADGWLRSVSQRGSGRVGGRPRVALNPFRRLPALTRRALVEEARRLAAFLS